MPPEAPEAAAAEADTAEAVTEDAARQALIDELEADEDAEAQNDEGDDDSAPAAKSKKGRDQKGRSKKESDDSTEDAGEDSEEDESDEGDEDEGEQAFESVDDFRDHIKTLLEGGDKSEVEKALNLEPGSLKINGARIRWVREQTQAANEKLTAAETKETNAQTVLDGARQYYGPYVQSRQAFQTGTAQGVLAAARAVEGHFGVPLATFVEMVVKAGRGEASAPVAPSPQQQPNGEMAQLLAKITKLETTINEQRTQVDTQAAETRHIAKITTAISKTDLAKLPDGAKRVYTAILGSYDQTKKAYTLDLRGAVKAVLADPATKWLLHEQAQKGGKGKTGNGKAPEARQTAERTPRERRRAPAAPARKLSPAEQEEAAKQALIDELEAEERKREREERRSRSNGRI